MRQQRQLTQGSAAGCLYQYFYHSIFVSLLRELPIFCVPILVDVLLVYEAQVKSRPHASSGRNDGGTVQLHDKYLVRPQNPSYSTLEDSRSQGPCLEYIGAIAPASGCSSSLGDMAPSSQLCTRPRTEGQGKRDIYALVVTTSET